MWAFSHFSSELESTSEPCEERNPVDDTISQLKEQLKSKDKEMERLNKKLQETERKLQIEQFGLERFGTDDTHQKLHRL